jgi:hypothetical protein
VAGWSALRDIATALVCLRRWVKVVRRGSAFGLRGHRTGVARMPMSRIASSVQRPRAANARRALVTRQRRAVTRHQRSSGRDGRSHLDRAYHGQGAIEFWCGQWSALRERPGGMRALGRGWACLRTWNVRRWAHVVSAGPRSAGWACTRTDIDRQQAHPPGARADDRPRSEAPVVRSRCSCCVATTAVRRRSIVAPGPEHGDAGRRWPAGRAWRRKVS